MAHKGLQLLGFTLSLLGLIGLIIGTIMPQWKMSAYVGDNIITAIAMYQGLWMSCAYQSTGQQQCKVYDSVLQLDSALQATRALMVVAILLTVAGLGVASMGMKCTNCGGDDKVKKSRIAMTGGIILSVGALCSIVACGWFTSQIIRDFYNPFTPVNTKYEFGAAIFIAWAGAFLDIMGGGMLASSCSKGQSSPNYPKSSRPVKSSRPPSSSKEYVWAICSRPGKDMINPRAWVEVCPVSWYEICLIWIVCLTIDRKKTAQKGIFGQLLLVFWYSSPPKMVTSFFWLAPCSTFPTPDYKMWVCKGASSPESSSFQITVTFSEHERGRPAQGKIITHTALLHQISASSC